MSNNITDQFNKFAGKEIDLNNKFDPTIQEIRKLAGQNGLFLRVWMPGIMGTMEVNNNRLNVHVDDIGNGKGRISKFRMG